VRGDVIDRQDIWVVQCTCRLCLLLEAAKSLWVGREGRREDFDRHIPVELWVSGAVHLTHPPCAEQRADLVTAKVCASGDGHHALLKIPSWEGKEGFSLQGWVSQFATTHPYTPPAEGNFHSSWCRKAGMDGSSENPP
jgi:hypothetical protein